MEIDETTLVVITAALAAYLGDNAAPKVTSIRRLASTESGWAAEGRRDLIDSRKL